MMSDKVILPGYKKTEVGVIPKDWEVVRLGEVGKFIGGGTPSIKIKEYWGGNIPWVSSSDLTEENIYRIHRHRFITDSAIAESATKKIPKNSVLIVSRVGVGKVAINKDIICTSQDFQSLVVENNNYIFLAYLIKWKIKLLDSYSQGTSIKGFVIGDLKKIQIPLPALKEQQKIADIFTTWDKAIDKQTILIQQKQRLKKGLMQQLLTGKTRFSGFIDDWKIVKLGDISKISTGDSNREDSFNNSGKYAFFDRSQDVRTSDIFLFDGEAVIIAGEGQEFIPKYFIGKFDLHQRTYAIMNFLNSTSKFIYYFICQNKNYFLSQAVGSTVKSLRLPMFTRMPIQLPVVGEQQKIAKILTLADEEITKLQTELVFLKVQKKGLTQQLLTGQIRVKL